MKICTKCNRVLSDDETTCPYCACEQLEDGAVGGDALMSAVLYDSATIELPTSEIEAALEAVDTELSDNYDFPEPPEEAEAEEQPPSALSELSERPGPESEAAPKSEGVPSERSAEEKRGGFKDSGGELEARVKDIVKAEGALEESDAPRKLGVTLIAILITAVLAFTVMCLVKYMKAPVESDGELMLDYISGKWLSEPFVYAQDLSHGYVEILEIRPDSTFTLTHLIPDAHNENGYQDGSWPVDYQISGELEIYAEQKCVLLKYSEFGKGYYIDRYVVRMEQDALALREYYDDEMSDSYDIIYKRIGAADTGSAAEGASQTTQTGKIS